MSLYAYRRCEEGVEITVGEPILGVILEREICFILRRRKGMTQEEVARHLQCCPYWVRKMENGTAPIKQLVDYWVF